MRWQDVRDMGINLFKKRNRSRTLWVGGGSLTFFSLLTLLLMLTGVSETHSGDIVCGTECESYINITTTYWRICFTDDFDLIKTDPAGVPVDVYVPTYGKKWREWNPQKDCLERGRVNQFKIVGHKEEWETVKWWSDALKVPDPAWKGVNFKLKSPCILNKTTKHINQTICWNETIYYNQTCYPDPVNGTTCEHCETFSNSTQHCWNEEHYTKQKCNYTYYYTTECAERDPRQWLKYGKEYRLTKEDLNIYCSQEKVKIICDECPEEDGTSDANCDGIIQPGESGVQFRKNKNPREFGHNGDRVIKKRIKKEFGLTWRKPQ